MSKPKAVVDPRCKQWVLVRPDGTFAAHTTKGGRFECKSSGLTPVGARLRLENDMAQLKDSEKG